MIINELFMNIIVIRVDEFSIGVTKLDITTILKIQSFSMGMLIFRQKSFQFFTPRLKTWQPVIPYSALWSKTFCWTKALQFLWSDFYWLSQSLIFLCCNFYFPFFLQKKLLLFFVLMQFDWARHYLDPWELCWKICISPILLFSLVLNQAHLRYLRLDVFKNQVSPN